MDAVETRTVELTLRNELSDVGPLRDAVDRCAAELAIPARSLFQLQVALDELVSNVIGYAWPQGGVHRFLVSVTLWPKAAKIDVIDDGVAFDPRPAASEAAPATERPHTIGGRGLGMLGQLVDRIDYARIDNRNHTTLHKNW
jgi:serine/threonine-protein kinase RsbW